MAKGPYIKYAAAVGDGPFPWDMLRYDFCSPASEGKDSLALDEIAAAPVYGVTRVVVLKRWNVAGIWTANRWRSFGWKLVHGKYDVGFDFETEARQAGENLAKEIEASRKPRKAVKKA